MECYSKTNRSLKFLTDILEVDIHPSESFKIEFAVSLRDFIVNHKLQTPIHNNIIILFVSFFNKSINFTLFSQTKLPMTENSFLWMIVSAIIQVFVIIVIVILHVVIKMFTIFKCNIAWFRSLLLTFSIRDYQTWLMFFCRLLSLQF